VDVESPHGGGNDVRGQNFGGLTSSQLVTLKNEGARGGNNKMATDETRLVCSRLECGGLKTGSVCEVELPSLFSSSSSSSSSSSRKK
jgi:hypothetical protein